MLKKELPTIDNILKNKIEVEKFKVLVKDMYRGFPNFIYNHMVEQVIIMEEVRDQLEKYGFLIKQPTSDGKGKTWNGWMLGPSALSLVSAWETEELTKKIKTLTIWVIVISGLAFLINLWVLIK